MDDVIKYNKERWEELAKANVMFSRPWLDLDKDSAHEMVDPERMVEDFSRKDVLCLAGGGGQQSAALALLGAEVVFQDPYWQINDGKGIQKKVKGSKEFRHTLSTLINGLIEEGFVIIGCWEEIRGEETNAEPGT